MENTLPKLALVGYGSMGKEIEKLAKEQGFLIANIFDIDSKLSAGSLYDFDVAIDFSSPDAVLQNVEILASYKKDIVIGTTGWFRHKEKIAEIVNSYGICVVYGTNFSIGMQMFFRIAKLASQLMNSTEGYDIMLHEMHHHRKKDSPSGTALTLAEIILKEVDMKTKIVGGELVSEIKSDMLHVSSTRGGEITGLHTIYLDSTADTIELTHRAKNRSGFAMGALVAAKWMKDNKGFFEFKDIMNKIWD